MSSEKPSSQSGHSLAPVAEFHAKQDRTIELLAEVALQVGRMSRIASANQQLDARNKMAFSESVDTLRRSVVDVKQLVERIKRDPSLTIIRDIPGVPVHVEAEKSGRDDEWSLVHIALPGAKKKIPVPNRILWGWGGGALGAIGGWIVHWLKVRGH
jgi:hypothetical protein